MLTFALYRRRPDEDEFSYVEMFDDYDAAQNTRVTRSICSTNYIDGHTELYIVPFGDGQEPRAFYRDEDELEEAIREREHLLDDDQELVYPSQPK